MDIIIDIQVKHRALNIILYILGSTEKQERRTDIAKSLNKKGKLKCKIWLFCTSQSIKKWHFALRTSTQNFVRFMGGKMILLFFVAT